MAEGWLKTPYNLSGKKIWIAGHNGMVGTALTRECDTLGFEILTVPKSELDLRDQTAVRNWMAQNKPDVVIIAAAKVGGILANDTYPADFLYDNLMIETNIIDAAYRNNVEKLLFLGSSCIYPKEAPQPITEEALLTASLEATNEAYAVAKIAGIKLCQAYRKQYGCDFISAMPCNLYGPGDTFDEKNSHVIPALIMKAHKAKMTNAKALEVWGSGTPRREFMHVDDCARGLIFLLENYSGTQHINLGTGEDMSIKELAQTIGSIVGFNGDLIFDTSKPDGTMRKVMDVSKIKQAGWAPIMAFEEGVRQTYDWYQEHHAQSIAA